MLSTTKHAPNRLRELRRFQLRGGGFPGFPPPPERPEQGGGGEGGDGWVLIGRWRCETLGLEPVKGLVDFMVGTGFPQPYLPRLVGVWSFYFLPEPMEHQGLRGQVVAIAPLAIQQGTKRTAIAGLIPLGGSKAQWGDGGPANAHFKGLMLRHGWVEVEA